MSQVVSQTNHMRSIAFFPSAFLLLLFSISKYCVGAFQVPPLISRIHTQKSIKMSIHTTSSGCYLNDQLIASSTQSPLPDPLALSKSLQRLMLQLKGSVMSDDGKRVNYEAMKHSDLYRQYKSLSPILRQYKINDIKNSLSAAQQFSFFVNIYNAMIINAYCEVGPPENTPAARTSFFSGASGVRYNICGLSFSPDDVEHGILRANTAHPSKQALGEIHYFAADDARSQLSVPTLDPRLHFILNCGAVSCPPIAVLGDDPKRALQVAAAGYLDSEISVSTSVSNGVPECTLYLPKLLLWYGNDFATDMKERLLRIFLLFSPSKRQEVESHLHLFGWPNEIKFTVAYSDYNWTPNSVTA